MAEKKTDSVRNVESEVAIIGALMMKNDLIDGVADRLKPEDFSEELFGRIYSVIVREASLGRAANAATLKPYLEQDPALEEVGGLKFLARLTADTGLLVIFRTAVDQVIDMARRRKLIAGLDRAREMANDMAASNDEVISEADMAISSLDENSEGVAQVSAEKAFSEMIEEYEKPKSGVTSGLIGKLDARLGPIRPHHLVIVGARPGMGKTALAVSYGHGAAKNGHGVLFITLEMKRVELMHRLTGDVCYANGIEIPYKNISNHSFDSDAQRRAVYRAGEFFKGMPFHFVDADSMTIGRLNMIVQRYKRRMAAAGQKLELVIVDYLQLLRPDFRCPPYEAISEVSRGLKGIAKRHDVGVLALAQLSRDVEKRDDKRPKLSDLRESGQIEQDADSVVFLYREHYYLEAGMPRETDPDYQAYEEAMYAVRDELDLIVAKRRGGSKGTVKVRYDLDLQIIRDRP